MTADAARRGPSRSPDLVDQPLSRADAIRQAGRILVGVSYFFLAGAVVNARGDGPEIPSWPILISIAGFLGLGAVGTFRAARRARRAAERLYGNTVEVPEAAWLTYGRRLGVVSLHVCIVSWLLVGLQAGPSGHVPNTPLIWIVLFSILGTLVWAALPERRESEAQRRERIQAQVLVTSRVDAELADELFSKMRQWIELNDEIHAKRKFFDWLKMRPQGELDKELGNRERKGSRRQVYFLLAGIPIGMMINWTSGPLLDAVVELIR